MLITFMEATVASSDMSIVLVTPAVSVISSVCYIIFEDMQQLVESGLLVGLSILLKALSLFHIRCGICAIFQNRTGCFSRHTAQIKEDVAMSFN